MKYLFNLNFNSIKIGETGDSQIFLSKFIQFYGFNYMIYYDMQIKFHHSNPECRFNNDSDLIYSSNGDCN